MSKHRPTGPHGSGSKDRGPTKQSKPGQRGPDRRPGSGRPDKGRPDKGRPDSGRSAKARPDRARSDAPRTEKPRFEKSRSERPRPGQGRPEQARPAQARFDKPRSERPRSAEGRPERARPEHARFEKPRFDKPRSERPRSAEGRPERARPEQAHFKKPRFDKPRAERPRPEKAHAAPRPETPRPSPRPERPAPEQARPALRPERPRENVREHEAQPRRAGEVWIYGHHPVAAALTNPDRKILRVVATTEATAKLTEEAAIPPRALAQIKTITRREIDALVGEDAVHQGVAILTHTLDYDLQEVLERIAQQAEAKPNMCIVVLDQVTDPHNVGAILRSAAAFGAAAVVAPDRHAPDETGTMAKSASGALDKIPYVKAGNLVRALELIKEHKFWLVGLAADAPQQLASIKLDGRVALVVGAEGEGLRRLVRETCDHVAHLPMGGGMESLNVSNATAVGLYERARQIS